MKKYITIIILVLFSSINFAQPVLQWQKCLGGTGDEGTNSVNHPMSLTFDGGFVIGGTTYSVNGDVSGNHGINDFWIVKLDSVGNTLWQKCLGGSNNESAGSIKQTSDSGYIVVGFSNSNDGDVSGSGGYGMTDCWVVKTDKLGTIQWQKRLGGNNTDIASCAEQTTDGGYIMVGSTYSNDGNVSGNHSPLAWNDYWVVKLDSIGNIQWQKCLGGSGDDYGRYIKQTKDGNYIVAGLGTSYDGDQTGSINGGTNWIIRLDSIGTIIWEKSYGGGGDEDTHWIEQTDDNGFVFVSSTTSTSGDVTANHGFFDYWVVKIDSLGIIQWQKCLGGSGDDRGQSIQQTSDHGYIVSGFSASVDGDVLVNYGGYDYWVVKLDSFGSIQWQKSFGGSDNERSFAIRQTKDNCYLAAGHTLSNNGDVFGNHGNQDYWVIKFCDTSSTTLIREISNSTIFRVSPNPFISEITISVQKQTLKKISTCLLNIFGQTIFAEEENNLFHTYSKSIDLSFLSKGIYYLDIEIDGERIMKKIVKE